MLKKKFRALILLNDDRKFWYYYNNYDGYYLINLQKGSPLFKEIIADDLQYIGLKDRDKKEIYEGDIIEKDNYRNGKVYKELHLVVFDYGGFCLKNLQDSEDGLFKKGALCGFGWSKDNLVLRKEKIVGNCYENPELMEASYVYR